MCGRYAISISAERVAAAFDALWDDLDLSRHGAGGRPALPRYNVAPTQMAPVVRAIGAGESAQRRISLLKWGLIPSWADDPAIGNRLINARAETAASKPSFRGAWKKRRCLVPITHFYEWRKDGVRKQPMAITTAATTKTSESEPGVLALAGLWESWHDEVESFTILTTSPNGVLESIHDRMPVVMPVERWSRWLDPSWEGPSGGQEIADWTAPAPDTLLRAFPVGTIVNAPRNDGPACLEPLGEQP